VAAKSVEDLEAALAAVDELEDAIKFTKVWVPPTT